MTWPTVRARYIFKRVDVRGASAPLASATVQGVSLRAENEHSVWNPGDDLSAYKLVEPGDFVIGLRSFQHGFSFSQVRGLVSPAYNVFRASIELEPRFYKYYFRSRHFITLMDNLSQGIRQGKTIDYEDFSGHYLQVPPLHEQRRIADFLDAETRRIDALVTLGERQATLMAEKQASLIFGTVTEGLNPNAQMTGVGNAWFLLMPQHWSLVAFRHLALRANAGEVIDKSWWGDGDEQLFTCSREPIASDFRDFPVEKRTGDNDILLTRNATPYVHLPQPGSIYSNVVQRVTLPAHFNRRWARYSLETASTSIHGYGVSIDTLNYGTWKALPLPVPPLKEQDDIARFLDDQTCAVAAEIASLRRRGELLQERRQALITAAVTGQLEVTTVRGAA